MKRGVDIWLVVCWNTRPLPFMQARASTALFVQDEGEGGVTVGRARARGDVTAGFRGLEQIQILSKSRDRAKTRIREFSRILISKSHVTA